MSDAPTAGTQFDTTAVTAQGLDERQRALGAGLAAFLSEHWGTRVTVPFLAESSAGARRQNVLFDADDGTHRHALVATIIPNAAIQILPIPDEAAMLRLAATAGVPVPHIHVDCADPRWVGGPFFIGSRVAGETVPRRVLRLVERVGHGEAIAGQLGAAFAALHALPEAKAPAVLVRPARPPAEQALANLALGTGNLLQPSPVFAYALRWLERHLPAPAPRLTIVHGDMRNGNLMIGEDGLRAILDWEGTRIGDPMEDLVWPCLRCWRFGGDAREVGGFGSRAALAEAYTAAGGRFDPDAFHWWKVVGTLRWGLGLAGQARTHLDGSVPSIVMAASGRRVAELEYDLLCLLRPPGASDAARRDGGTPRGIH
jgi:aminoglycoside phosphotransferase (APT) family kinase protein